MGKTGKINNLLIPNVTKKGGQNKSVGKEKLEDLRQEFQSQLENAKEASKQGEVRFSKHAQKRLEERNLSLDGEEYFKLKDAIDKLKNKGGKDSLVITGNAAYIVDVDNETVVTAMGKDDMAENVFTKIDSTLFIN